MSDKARFEFTIDVNGQKKKLYYKRPDQGQMFEIELAYKKSMTMLIDAGVMTTHKASKKFADSGEWSMQDEQDLRNLSDAISLRERDLNQKKSKNTEEENIKIATDIKSLRSDHLSLVLRKNDLFRHCAEHLAEEQKMHVIARQCLYDCESNGKFFDTDAGYQKFLTDEDTHDAASVIFDRTYAFEYNYTDNFGENWAEEVYFNELKEAKAKENEEGDSESVEEESTEAELTQTEVAVEEPLEKKKRKRKKKKRKRRSA